ncbi:MAG: transketolase [Candidatus Omnitrophota bacterium]|nr:MAG: transketolase [Candidatus Omnitrophota bacterium]
MAFQLTRDVNTIKSYAKTIRMNVIKMLTEAASGHPGGSLSATDVVAALLFAVMRHDPTNPKWDNRDRFIMSKGHCIPAWYAALAQAGYFDEKELCTLRRLGSRLQGHPDRCKLEAIEASTGSLGQGLSIALGMAMAAKMNNADWRVYCMIGDGESQEGQIWEAVMAAAKFKTDNLTVILDHNNGQIDGYVADVMPIMPIEEKFRAFNWHVIGVDGHDINQILNALDEAADTKGRPTLILANTVKGKGVSFMENNIGWHGKAPSKEEEEKALQELAAI